jgi:endonuclease YncB( thermonuclease family)
MRATPWSRRRNFRNPLGTLATLAAIAVVAVIAGLLWPPPATLSGRASAVDGDTLRIGETRIRLLGFDAVEHDQTCRNDAGEAWDCGREARSFLAGLVKGETTSCAADGRDRYRRVLARCAVARSDLGEQMVHAGWAVAELEYGLALADARLNRRGIWSGTFDDPADWRRTHGTDTFDFWTWLTGLLGRW